jgi:hypothetical protein
MATRTGAALIVVVLTGCGGTSRVAPKPPTLPHALAQAWQTQADQIATALAAGDGCGAQQRAVTLRTQVIAAVNARRIPRRLLEPLTSAVNSLPDRISCAPAPPVEQPKHKPKKPKKPKHGHKGHGGD